MGRQPGIGLSEHELSTVLEAWRGLSVPPAGAKLILFGSMAHGSARPQSDIDLAVKASEPVPLAVLAELEEALEESDLVRTVDVLDYMRLSASMQRQIDRDGVRVV